MLRTPRHDYGPTASASTPASYATPRGNALSSSQNAMNTPGPSSGGAQHSFEFLQHPLFADPESLQGGLKFDGLYSNMSDFKETMDHFVEDSCSRIEQSKENHAVLKDAKQSEVKQVEREADIEKKAQHELWTAIAAEREEDAEARRVQSEKERHVHSLSSQLADIQGELDEIRGQFASRRDEKRRAAGKMKEMAKLNVPERELLESRTGCRIDSPGDDLISFTFSMLDAKRPAEVAYFVFALHQRKYTMPIVQPALPEGEVKGLLDELNKTRNAFKHIKEMRRLLKREVERGASVAMPLGEATAALVAERRHSQ